MVTETMTKTVTIEDYVVHNVGGSKWLIVTWRANLEEDRKSCVLEGKHGDGMYYLLRCLNRTWYTIRIEQNVA